MPWPFSAFVKIAESGGGVHCIVLCRSLPARGEIIPHVWEPWATDPKEMLIGFKRSVRGNIRQSPNVITWITTLQNLKKWGADWHISFSRDPQTWSPGGITHVISRGGHVLQSN